MTAYPIPDDALDDRLGIVGTSGAGKTYTAMGAVERLLASGARCVIVDPLDVWWGLRLSADGEKASKFKLPILGGSHGDLPLTEHSGALIGETVSGMADSCIVSLGGFSSGAAERRFMLAFLNALYRRSSGSLFHLILDEADLWAPQQVLDKDGGSMQLKGIVDGIVRRGRVKGFVPWLITQRPAVIDKSIMSMMVGLIAMKAMSPHDRGAIMNWLKGQMTDEQRAELDTAMPQLNIGEGIVWIPGRNVLHRAQFPTKATFDSSRAPQRGEAVAERELKPLDLGALKDRLATVETEVKANDPKALKAEVARLTRVLAKAGEPPAIVDSAALQAADERGFRRGHSDGYTEGLLQSKGAMAALRKGISEAMTLIQQSVELAVGELAVSKASPVSIFPTSQAVEKIDAAPRPRATPSAPLRTAGRSASADLGAKGRVLQSLAWWKAAGFPAIDRRRACIMAGYSPKASTFGVYIGQLSAAGLICVPEPGKIALTDTGAAEAPAPDFNGSLVDAVRALLSPAEVKVFDAVVDAYPAGIGRGELADTVGLSRTASTLGVYVGKVASFGFIESTRGQVRAADWLFPGA